MKPNRKVGNGGIRWCSVYHNLCLSFIKIEGGSLLFLIQQPATYSCAVPSMLQDMMVKDKIEKFCHIGYLVTRAAFNSDKVDIVDINDPLINLNYRVYMFQCSNIVLLMVNFSSTFKAENRKFVINESPSPYARSKTPATSNTGAEYVLESYYHGVFTTLEKARAHFKGGSQSHHLCTSDTPKFVMGMNH